MAIRRVFVVQKKTFTLSFAKDKVELSEKSKSVQVSIGIEESLAKWVA